jgi:hypothetical protein
MVSFAFPASIGDFVSKDLAIAIAKSGYCSFQSRNAAGTPRAHQSHGGYGISCLRDRKVSTLFSVISTDQLTLIPFSEGPHAKYHFMICGVQGELFLRFMWYLDSQKLLGKGDFTRGLVNDPPRTLWTRELKVSGLLVITPCPADCNAFHSSQVYRTLPHSTNVAFGYAQVPVLAPRCQLASSLLIGEVYSGLHMTWTMLTDHGCRFLIWIGEAI